MRLGALPRRSRGLGVRVDSAHVRAILSIVVTAVTAVTRLWKPVAECAHVSESEASIVMIAIHYRASTGDGGDDGDDDFMILVMISRIPFACRHADG